MVLALLAIPYLDRNPSRRPGRPQADSLALHHLRRRQSGSDRHRNLLPRTGLGAGSTMGSCHRGGGVMERRLQQIFFALSLLALALILAAAWQANTPSWKNYQRNFLQLEAQERAERRHQGRRAGHAAGNSPGAAARLAARGPLHHLPSGRGRSHHEERARALPLSRRISARTFPPSSAAPSAMAARAWPPTRRARTAMSPSGQIRCSPRTTFAPPAAAATRKAKCPACRS